MRVSVCAARLKVSPPRSVRTKSEMVRVLRTVLGVLSLLVCTVPLGFVLEQWLTYQHVSLSWRRVSPLMPQTSTSPVQRDSP